MKFNPRSDIFFDDSFESNIHPGWKVIHDRLQWGKTFAKLFVDGIRPFRSSYVESEVSAAWFDFPYPILSISSPAATPTNSNSSN